MQIVKFVPNNKYFPYILFLICLITRLLFFGRYIDDWDGVNFAFALTKGYDVFNDQPHFQGYPVYMFVSWIIYNFCHSDIISLILPGIIFSSLAIIPFYSLVYRMFSRQVAFLAVGLYIINPQIWLQSEKTLSDAFGLFFVITAIYFLYRAIEPSSEITSNPSLEKKGIGVFAIFNRYSLLWLFLGSLTLGLGIGVRISYMAFVFTWAFVVFLICKEQSVKNGILFGSSGFVLGVTAWLGFFAIRFGIVNYLNKFMSHSDYHFSDESYSIFTSNGFLDRLITIFKNITAHSLGVYWSDTPLLRILPTVVMIIAVFAYVIKERFDLKNKFILISVGAYVAWLIIVQTAIRHTMVLAPFIIIIIATGIFYFVNSLKRENKQRKWLLPLVLFFIIAPMAFDSGRLVWINRTEKPPQVALIEYITDNYERDKSKFYCLNTWRLFQYYEPKWRDDRNRYVYFTSRMSRVEQNIRNRNFTPKNALISSKLYERHKYKDRLHKVKVFKRDNYAVAEYNELALYEFDTNHLITKKRVVDDKTASELVKILSSLAVIENSDELNGKED